MEAGVDLRVRLVVWLSGFSLALLAGACVVVGLNLRQDVAEEMAASARLADLMLGISQAGSAEQIAGLLAAGELRHVQVRLDRSVLEQSPAAGLQHLPPSGAEALLLALAGGLLPAAPDAGQARRIELAGPDGAVIEIRAQPLSELREILRDAARLLGVLVLFAAGTVLAAWFAADRALRPVRALEDGLARLARGEPRAALPPFSLKEFSRIADAIDQLADSLAQSRASERRLGRSLMEVQETERRELARELHDEFGQSLTAIGAAAAFVERHAAGAEPAALAECARDIRGESGRMAAQVRGLLRQLRPHGLDGLGMLDALRELIAGWRQRAPQISIGLALPASLPALPPDAGLALYRTAQEALTNVLRHAGASRVDIALGQAGGELLLRIADNGCGRAGEILGRAGGGLLGMRERAAMAGGALMLDDTPGGGLTVGLRLTTRNEEERGDDPHHVAR